MSDPVALGQPTVGAAELAAVAEVFASGWLSGAGPTCAAFEQRFAGTAGTAHALATSSCGSALHLALLALGAGPGDEVVVADYTFPATGHAVLWTGATPVFADVRPDIWSVDPAAVEAAITARTVGILAVDPFGQPADYDELRAVADRHGLLLVEDAACAAGASYRGRPAGSLADIALLQLPRAQGDHRGRGRRAHHRRPGVGRRRAPAAHLRRRAGSPRARPPRRCRSRRSTRPATTTGCPTSQAGIMLAQLDRLPTLLAAARRGGPRVRRAAGRAGAGRAAVRGPGPGRTRGSPTSSRCTRTSTGARSRWRCGPGASAAPSAPTPRTCSRVYGPQKPLPVSADLFAPPPGHPDARQPDRPRRSTASPRRCARSSRCPTYAADTPPGTRPEEGHHGERPHRARHRRRRLDRAAHRPAAARARLPGAHPGQHGPRRPGRGRPGWPRPATSSWSSRTCATAARCTRR